MTHYFRAADQRVIVGDKVTILIVMVDAEKPKSDDWHVSYLAPVRVEPGRALTHVVWRGPGQLAAA